MKKSAHQIWKEAKEQNLSKEEFKQLLLKEKVIMKTNFQDKYHLSTDGYYFKYRLDNNNQEVTRATLYNLRNERVDDVRVSEGYGLPEKSHHQIINHFEARLSMGTIS